MPIGDDEFDLDNGVYLKFRTWVKGIGDADIGEMREKGIE